MFLWCIPGCILTNDLKVVSGLLGSVNGEHLFEHFLTEGFFSHLEKHGKSTGLWAIEVFYTY